MHNHIRIKYFCNRGPSKGTRTKNTHHSSSNKLKPPLKDFFKKPAVLPLQLTVYFKIKFAHESELQ